jgi:hypothetical protein
MHIIFNDNGILYNMPCTKSGAHEYSFYSIEIERGSKIFVFS